MNSLSILAFSIFAIARADAGSDASAVISQANALASLVKGWSKDEGLSGALVIQQSYDPLSKAVGALASSAGGIEVNSDNVKLFGELSSSITALLSTLVDKAGDFSSVGADKIVQGDISNLAGPSGEIVSKIFDKGKSDCSAVSALSDPLNSLKGAFESAAKAFSASAPSFPDLKCEGGSSKSDASSSSAASSSAASSSSESKETAKTSATEATSATSPVPANGAFVVGSSLTGLIGALLL